MHRFGERGADFGVAPDDDAARWLYWVAFADCIRRCVQWAVCGFTSSVWVGEWNVYKQICEGAWIYNAFELWV